MADLTENTVTTALSALPGAGEVGRSPRRYRRRLASLTNARTCLADIVGGLEHGSLDPAVGRAMIYGVAVLIAVLKEEREARLQADVEGRLAALERSTGPGTP